MTKIGKQTVEQAAPEHLAVRAATIEKGNGGALGYEVGKHVATGEPALRVVSNSSSGTFSKEWVAFLAIRKALAGAPERFPASTLAPAIAAKGKNNTFFIAAALVGEGLLARHQEGGLVLAGDWGAWGDAVRALPLPEIPPPSPPPSESPASASNDDAEATSTPSTAALGKKSKKAKAGSSTSSPPPPEPVQPEAEPVPQEAAS
ncbi:MAG: hypothetical protein SF028_14605 [Candidatus Sumerlaeia bacterium]|nr:hypothetical protein [Candidatus Sumerlaeia bacterium]